MKSIYLEFLRNNLIIFQFATKASKAVIPECQNSNHNGKENYEKSSVQVLSTLHKKEPLCTPLPKPPSTDQWEIITTDWKNVHMEYLKLSKIRLTSTYTFAIYGTRYLLRIFKFIVFFQLWLSSRLWLDMR